jgi:TPR repeat protein
VLLPQSPVPEFRATTNRLPSVYENFKPREPSRLPEPPSLPPIESSSGISGNDLEMAKQYYFGRGENLDLVRAYELFVKSANRGNPESARYLGIMYLRGKGVDKDSRKALEWFTRAAQGGDEIAKKNLKALQILSGSK